MASTSSVETPALYDEKPNLADGMSEGRVETVVVHTEFPREEGEQQRNGAAMPEMMVARIGTCLESMEAQMGNTNRLLEQLVKEMKGLREDFKVSKAKEVQIATARFDKLLAEEVRSNDLIEKALYAEPSANLFANSKERHPHKAYLRVMLDDLETMKRKLR